MDLFYEMGRTPRSVREFAYGPDAQDPTIKTVDSVEKENTPKDVPQGKTREVVRKPNDPPKDPWLRW